MIYRINVSNEKLQEMAIDFSDGTGNIKLYLYIKENFPGITQYSYQTPSNILELIDEEEENTPKFNEFISNPKFLDLGTVILERIPT